MKLTSVGYNYGLADCLRERVEWNYLSERAAVGIHFASSEFINILVDLLRICFSLYESKLKKSFVENQSNVNAENEDKFHL